LDYKHYLETILDIDFAFIDSTFYNLCCLFEFRIFLYFRNDDWRSSGNNGGGNRGNSGFDSGNSGFEGFDRKPASSGFDGFDRKQPSSGSNLWEKEFEVMKTTNVKTKTDWSNTFEDSSSNNNK
jgi:hypothetical protein